MTVLSILRSGVRKLFLDGVKKGPRQQRCMSADHGPKQMVIVPSRFQWNKFKDLFHFYTMVGAIPLGLLIFYTNVFIGPSTLRETPEGYTPKHWEYYSNPITRFLARNIYNNPQQEYEKYLHFLYEEDEKMKIRALEKQINNLMAERNDYQAFYYIPVDGKYHRISRKASEDVAEMSGFISTQPPPPTGI